MPGRDPASKGSPSRRLCRFGPPTPLWQEARNGEGLWSLRRSDRTEPDSYRATAPRSTATPTVKRFTRTRSTSAPVNCSAAVGRSGLREYLEAPAQVVVQPTRTAPTASSSGAGRADVSSATLLAGLSDRRAHANATISSRDTAGIVSPCRPGAASTRDHRAEVIIATRAASPEHVVMMIPPGSQAPSLARRVRKAAEHADCVARSYTSMACTSARRRSRIGIPRCCCFESVRHAPAYFIATAFPKRRAELGRTWQTASSTWPGVRRVHDQCPLTPRQRICSTRDDRAIKRGAYLGTPHAAIVAASSLRRARNREARLRWTSVPASGPRDHPWPEDADEGIYPHISGTSLSPQLVSAGTLELSNLLLAGRRSAPISDRPSCALPHRPHSTALRRHVGSRRRAVQR